MCNWTGSEARVKSDSDRRSVSGWSVATTGLVWAITLTQPTTDIWIFLELGLPMWVTLICQLEIRYSRIYLKIDKIFIWSDYSNIQMRRLLGQLVVERNKTIRFILLHEIINLVGWEQQQWMHTNYHCNNNYNSKNAVAVLLWWCSNIFNLIFLAVTYQ